MVPAPTKPSKQQKLVTLEINPASVVDQLGELDSPLLVRGTPRAFTPAEAHPLLALVDAYGTPTVRRVQE